MEDNKNTAEVTEETVSSQDEEVEIKECSSKAEKKTVKKLEDKLADAQKEIEKQKAELAEANDKYLRMIAEYDNFRRRSAKEKESVYSDAYAEVLSKILPVIDNLERASAYKDAENVSKGLEMTLKAFCDTLEKLNITEIEAIGKTFDPNLHNAVFHIEDEAYGESEITEVLQKGYKYGDKVLRYAMVKVAN